MFMLPLNNLARKGLIYDISDPCPEPGAHLINICKQKNPLLTMNFYHQKVLKYSKYYPW